MKLAILAVAYGALRHEHPGGALQAGASFLEEAGAPLARASAFSLPTGLTRASGRPSVAMQAPDPDEIVSRSFSFQGKDPSQLSELQPAELPSPLESLELEEGPGGRGPGLLQGLFGARSEERLALRLKDELPKEARETLHGRMVHWALMEGTQHNPNFEGKTLLELREQAPELERIIRGDAAHAGEHARANPVVKSRVRERLLDFASRLSEPGPWVPGAVPKDLQWADGVAKGLLHSYGYVQLRADPLFGPFIKEAEKLAKGALRDDANPHGLLRNAAKLGLLLKDGDDGNVPQVVTAEAIECMRAEYSHAFVEAALAMYRRFQKDFAINLGMYYQRKPKQELKAIREDLLSMPNRERRNLVLKGMATGALLYGLVPDAMDLAVWNRPSVRTIVRGPPPPVFSEEDLTKEQELRRIEDLARKAGLY